MSYFDPENYKFEYLTEEDKAEVNYWMDNLDVAIDLACEDISVATLEDLFREFAEKIKDRFGEQCFEYTVSRLDDYDRETYIKNKAKADAEAMLDDDYDGIEWHERGFVKQKSIGEERDSRIRARFEELKATEKGSDLELMTKAVEDVIRPEFCEGD